MHKRNLRRILKTSSDTQKCYGYFWKHLSGNFKDELLEFNEVFKEVALEKGIPMNALVYYYNNSGDAKRYGKI